MKTSTLITALILFMALLACKSEKEDVVIQEPAVEQEAMVFDQVKWRQKEGRNYPYREQMLNDVLYNDTIRSLTKTEFVALLGEPDRTNNDHLYYLISRTGIGAFTLHAKTMVVKIKEDDTIEWIKVHG